MRKTTTLIAALVVGGLLVGETVAEARGVVLKREKTHVYVDIGHESGVVVGSRLTLYHVISVKHPVSKKKVRDSFPLTTLRVVNAGSRLSIAVAPAEVSERINVGDEVVLSGEKQTYVDPWKRPDVNAPANDAEDRYRVALEGRKKQIALAKGRIAAEATVEAVWQQSLGRSLADRLELWRAFVRENPRSPYASNVNTHIQFIAREMERRTSVAELTDEQKIARAALERLGKLDAQMFIGGPLAYRPPLRVRERVPLDLAFLVTEPGAIESGFIYYRTVGEANFKRAPLQKEGDMYVRALVPGPAVRPPGLEYFVDIVKTGTSDSEAVIASDALPYKVDVFAEPRAKPTDRRNRSRVRVFTDYVDFDGYGTDADNDQYLHTEIDFMYRFKKRSIYSLRLGVGSMAGKGGPKDVIDNDPSGCMLGGVYMCRKVGYNYAFAELEWRISDMFAFMIRPQWGSAYLDRAPTANEDREFFDAFGVRGRVRIGNEQESNLVLGTNITQRLGKVFEAAFTWDVIPVFPLVLSVQVTDQPVLEDFGVRLIADIGWRGVGWVYPSVRLAYQARDLDHAGPSAGLAANFDW